MSGRALIAHPVLLPAVQGAEYTEEELPGSLVDELEERTNPEQRHFAAFQAQVGGQCICAVYVAGVARIRWPGAPPNGLVAAILVPRLASRTAMDASPCPPPACPLICRWARSPRSACATALTPPPSRCGPAAKTSRDQVGAGAAGCDAALYAAPQLQCKTALAAFLIMYQPPLLPVSPTCILTLTCCLPPVTCCSGHSQLRALRGTSPV